MHRRTLGIFGLGGIGRNVTRIAQALNMQVIACSQNLTAETAAAAGVTYVVKDELFKRADIVTLHLVLGERNHGIVGPRELALMKPTSFIINTAGAGLIDEQALINALQSGRIAGAALDVFWEEPVPPDHPLLTLDNVVLAPHLGYVVEESYRAFYQGLVETVSAFLAGKPIRLSNPAVIPRSAVPRAESPRTGLVMSRERPWPWLLPSSLECGDNLVRFDQKRHAVVDRGAASRFRRRLPREQRAMRCATCADCQNINQNVELRLQSGQFTRRWSSVYLNVTVARDGSLGATRMMQSRMYDRGKLDLLQARVIGAVWITS